MTSTAASIAATLVAARREARGIAAFPEPVPETLEGAYAIQREAIALRGEAIAGWKVGRLNPQLEARYGIDRFIGPVFAGQVSQVQDGEAAFPIFAGGSGAFEAEYVVVLKTDAPDSDAAASIETARALVGALHIGIEIAGSPVAAIPALDSLASIADHGNNNGQVVGAALPVAMLDDPAALTCATTIDGELVRTADAAALPGGPLKALAFAIDEARRQGMPLKAGQFVSTGAVTGVHWVRAGQQCVADFGPWGVIACRTVDAAAA